LIFQLHVSLFAATNS